MFCVRYAQAGKQVGPIDKYASMNTAVQFAFYKLREETARQSLLTIWEQKASL